MEVSSVLKRSPLLWTIWHTLEVLFLQLTFEEANWSRSKYGWYLHDEAFLSRILTQKLTKFTLSPSLRFNDSAKNKMIQVNNNLNFPLQKFITSQLPVSRQNPWSVVSILLDIFQETLPLFLPAPLSYLMIYIALLSLSTNLSEWQCSLCSAKMRNSLIQNKSMLHFYTRRFLKFSMDTEKERWREWVNEKLHSTPITHSKPAIKTSIKWVEYVQSRQ